jgi:hypothetical protein
MDVFFLSGTTNEPSDFRHIISADNYYPFDMSNEDFKIYITNVTTWDLVYNLEI